MPGPQLGQPPLLTSIHLAEQCTGDGDGEPPPRATPKSDAKAHSASRSADIDAPRANRARIAAKARLFLKRQLFARVARRDVEPGPRRRRAGARSATLTTFTTFATLRRRRRARRRVQAAHPGSPRWIELMTRLGGRSDRAPMPDSRVLSRYARERRARRAHARARRSRDAWRRATRARARPIARAPRTRRATRRAPRANRVPKARGARRVGTARRTRCARRRAR